MLIGLGFGGKVHHPRGGSATIAAQGWLSGRAAVESCEGLPPTMPSQGETGPADMSDCPGDFQRATILTLDVGWHFGFTGGDLAGIDGIVYGCCGGGFAFGGFGGGGGPSAGVPVPGRRGS